MKFWTTLIISLMLISIAASLTSLYYSKTASKISSELSNTDLDEIETALDEIKHRFETVRSKKQLTPDEEKSIEILKTDLANQESKLKEASSQIESRQQYQKYSDRFFYIYVIAVFAAIFCVLRLLKEKHKLRLGKDAELTS